MIDKKEGQNLDQTAKQLLFSEETILQFSNNLVDSFLCLFKKDTKTTCDALKHNFNEN